MIESLFILTVDDDYIRKVDYSRLNLILKDALKWSKKNKKWIIRNAKKVIELFADQLKTIQYLAPDIDDSTHLSNSKSNGWIS